MGRPCGCRPCKKGTLPHLCCTHRAFQGTGWVTALWSEHMDNQRECTAVIRDLLISSGNTIFLTGLSEHRSAPVVQSWGTNGQKQWSTDLPAGFDPLRLATDGTQVWVVGNASLGADSLLAYNATTGALIWSESTPLGALSVCSDGAGGCFVGTRSQPEVSDVGCASPDDGPIRRYNSSGVKTAEFGRGGPVTALVVVGGKLWAGSAGFQTALCCDLSRFFLKPWRGHLARYAFDGTMEILCANPWETGGGPGSEAVVTLPQNSYVSRLGYYNSRLYAAYHQIADEIPWEGRIRMTGEMHVSVAEWNPSNGRLVSAWNLETDDALDDYRTGVTGMDGDSSNIVVTFDKFSLLRTDLDINAGTVGGGGLVPALDSSGGLYAAIVNQLCRVDQPSSSTTTTDANPGDPCNCAGATPFGRVNVDCGCDSEDDGVPCEVTFYQSFDGCLSDFPSSVPLTLTSALSSQSQAIWEGDFTLTDPGTCEDGYNVDVKVIYTCPNPLTGSGGGTWRVEYTVYDALRTNVMFRMQKNADPADVSCSGPDGHPGFTIDWTEDDIADDALMPECFGCGETTGCSGFLACLVETACCENSLPELLVGTITDATECDSIEGAVNLVWQADQSAWVGAHSRCGEVVTYKLECTGSGVGDFDITTTSPSGDCDASASAAIGSACDPLELEFFLSPSNTCGCCDPGAGAWQYTLTITE